MCVSCRGRAEPATTTPSVVVPSRRLEATHARRFCGTEPPSSPLSNQRSEAQEQARCQPSNHSFNTNRSNSIEDFNLGSIHAPGSKSHALSWLRRGGDGPFPMDRRGLEFAPNIQPHKARLSHLGPPAYVFGTQTAALGRAFDPATHPRGESRQPRLPACPIPGQSCGWRLCPITPSIQTPTPRCYAAPGPNTYSFCSRASF